jgi:hypothetical protein
MAGINYLVLTSTNLTLPLADWNIIATNPFGPGGGFSFTNAISGSVPNLFYLLEAP